MRDTDEAVGGCACEWERDDDIENEKEWEVGAWVSGLFFLFINLDI